jgi:hypothetical protein
MELLDGGHLARVNCRPVLVGDGLKIPKAGLSSLSLKRDVHPYSAPRSNGGYS